MSHALPAPHLDLDAKRIAATSGVIAIHALALMLLLAPVQWSPPAAVADDPETIWIVPEQKIKPIVPPPPTETHQVRRDEPPRPQPAPQPIVDETPVISDEGTEQAVLDPPPANDFGTQTVAPTGPVDLRVLVGPAPPYPVIALRQGITGKVVLRIEVDAEGHPVDGKIERSSGSRILDQAALKCVLAKWRFEPAQWGGHAIASTALVPVEFTLGD
jgi:protein TonB